jgi:hypothetical protein
VALASSSTGGIDGIGDTEASCSARFNCAAANAIGRINATMCCCRSTTTTSVKRRPVASPDLSLERAFS